MGRGGSDKVVLSFGDAVVRESDLKLLSGPHWLNDRIISFYFEYLHQKKFDSSTRVVFVSPEVSQFLKLVSNAEIPIFLEPLALEEGKDVILFAVNNSNNPDEPGGSHWSLLIYSSQSEEFYHLDSSSGLNSNAARQIACRLHSFLSKKMLDLGKAYGNLKITEVPVLQQSNGYDCGIHLIANAEHATRHFLVYGSSQGLDSLPEANVKKMRQEVKSLILEMAGLSDDR